MNGVSIHDDIRTVLAGAGVQGWMHARTLDGNRVVDVDADVSVPTASLYKFPLLIAFCEMVDARLVDPREQVRLTSMQRTAGPTGISTFSDDVVMSWRDIARLMIAVSDNAAGDAMLGPVGVERTNQTLARLGMRQTRIIGGSADSLRGLTDDTGARTIAEAFEILADLDRPIDPSAYDPVLSSSTTPSDMTHLMAELWNGRALSAAQNLFAQDLLNGQVWTHRIASGFAYDGVRIAGKTGTLGVLRHEVAMVELPDRPRIAVAVFTLSARPDGRLPRADRAIGDAARLAVRYLLAN